MEEMRRRIEDGEGVSAGELGELLRAIGLSSGGEHTSEAAQALAKMYKNMPASVASYLAFNPNSASAKGYKFFCVEEIVRQVEELIRNNTWNNHFMPLGELTSVQRGREQLPDDGLRAAE